jgi:hypothetical protein
MPPSQEIYAEKDKQIIRANTYGEALIWLKNEGSGDISGYTDLLPARSLLDLAA